MNTVSIKVNKWQTNDDDNENLFIFTIISFHDLFVPRTKSTPLTKFPVRSEITSYNRNEMTI